LREDVRPIAFLPVSQEPNPGEVTLAIRARGPFGAVMAGVRDEMARLDGGMLVEFRVFDEQVAGSVLRERLVARLSAGFGFLAVGLCTLGLYGVMGYMVARRRTELGVRMALGASAFDILRLVVSEAGRLVAFGLALGLVGAFVVSRYAESLLYGLQPNDTLTLGAACFVLAITGIAAALLPARRAARLDPAVVLSDD
jgi:ABC-type antimicrobial peptide transport system permease subunit